MDQKEIRVIRKPLELRATAGDDGGSVFSGYVYKFAARSGDLGGFVETIAKGAAAKWLAAPSKNLFAILDHEKNICNVLGDLESKTLALAEDDVGLRFEIHAGPTTAARDAAVVVGRNPVGMSFAFVKGIDRWSILPDGTRLRELLEFADLDDISIVVDAAYKSSDVTVAKRGLQEAIDADSPRGGKGTGIPRRGPLQGHPHRRQGRLGRGRRDRPRPQVVRRRQDRLCKVPAGVRLQDRRRQRRSKTGRLSPPPP